MNADQSILAVEDDPVTRRLVGWILSRHDFRVLEARNLAEAWNWLSTDPDLALILSDYQLPDGTGLDLLAGLSGKNRSQVPFLLVSGTYAPPSNVGHEIEFLAKPFTPEQLLAAIGQLLHQPVPPMRFSGDSPPPERDVRSEGERLEVSLHNEQGVTTARAAKDSRRRTSTNQNKHETTKPT